MILQNYSSVVRVDGSLSTPVESMEISELVNVALRQLSVQKKT